MRKYKVKLYPNKSSKKRTTHEFRAQNRTTLIKRIKRDFGKNCTISSINNIPSYSKKKK